MQEKIYLYYTNDLHSNFAQWPKVAEFMKTSKEKRQRNDDSYWLFDIGDHVDRVHPIAEGLMGKGNIDLLNEIGYDAVTIGNNEGITFAHEDLFHLYDEANFQVVCANLQSLDNVLPPWLKSTIQVQTKQGVKIGVIGLTAPFNDYYELLGWHVADPYEVLEKQIKTLTGSVDIIVLMSHLGINEDEEIARRFPEIDVIIGGHTHHLLRTGEQVNQAIITAAGKHCYFAGEVILTWDHQGNKLINMEAFATDISNYPENHETKALLKNLQHAANEKLNKTIITIEEPIRIGWYENTPIMEQLVEKILRETGAECAMFNAGLLLDHFPTGEITLGDIHRICPHPINPCIVELTGAELLEVVRASLTDEFMNFELKGFGFRGKVLGKMVFAGIEVQTDYHPNGKEYVDEIYYKGEPISLDKTYQVVTADSFTFGRLLPEVAKSEKKTYILPTFIRDYLADTLREYYGE
ncbi:bifunctional metallophosphatase/5'-nucleotidase [Ornithinibacillus bavariensis]|uniref:bifunctional metallophosphatase/5'-nucleotidase n=1 Tax=Ornithinibacillus bavariensis TaxID=545502 RepID=UPI000ED54621|nr:bifunctional metallophosphatase/5'-nucleotidase [Ornithinibacillus sp.]